MVSEKSIEKKQVKVERIEDPATFTINSELLMKAQEESSEGELSS